MRSCELETKFHQMKRGSLNGSPPISTIRVGVVAVSALALPLRSTAIVRGGTIRFTAPYGASFVSNDSHVSNQIQDEIYGYALHGMLYKWDAKNGKPVLDIAESVQVSADGKTYTYKLRDNALFHNGRKLTSDDVIWSYTRIMDGSKNYPGARYVARIVGATDVQKGQAKEISGLKKIDDFTLEMTLTDKVDPGYYFFVGSTAILPKEEVEKGNFAANPVGLGPYKFKEHIPGSRVVAERFNVGVATTTELLDAQVALLQADLDRTRAMASIRLAEARLDRALGR